MIYKWDRMIGISLGDLLQQGLGETPFWDHFIGVARCCTELGNLTLIPTPQNGLEVAVPDGNHTV